MTGIIYGILIYRHNFSPYEYIGKVYYFLIQKVIPVSPWEIGIYEGPTPFDLSDPEHISNPVLTRRDITDVNARFVADPFMIIENEKYTMFFEVLNHETNLGHISYAESTDGKQWEYKRIIIDEPFHLSYPYVFQWNDDYYLIPESGEDLSVRLYRAVSFPDKWEYLGNLISGHNYLDPSIFQYNDMWWLFVSSGEGVLNLYYSIDLLKGWRPHPKNPIVRFNKNISRPGGRVFTHGGKIYRLTQDCGPSYGFQVFAFEITKLTEEFYEEKIASEKPIVTSTGKGWNAGRMHHVDLHKVGDRWVGSVDGRSK